MEGIEMKASESESGVSPRKYSRHDLVNRVHDLCELFENNQRVAEDAIMDVTAYRKVEAPPPRHEDVCVSPENGPDYDPKYFAGGVTEIARGQNGILRIHFAHGGEIHVSNPVVYLAPETH
jgi:hypothetical protein